MKKLFALVIIAVMLFTVSCSDNSWKGFEDEDLSKYLSLGEYKGLSYNKVEVGADPNEVEAQISSMLEAASELVETDNVASSSSIVKIDRYCFLNGVSTPELSAEGQTYYIDTDYEDIVLNTVLSACSGKKKGDTFTVNLPLPAGYKGIAAESKAEFRVTVLGVYEKTTPKLTDSIAPTLIPGCNSVEELRNTIAGRIEKQQLESGMDKVRSELKEILINSSKVIKMPVSVFNAYYEDEITLFKNLANALDMPLEEYAEKELGMSGTELENMVAQIANTRTKEALVLYSIVKIENIVMTDAILLEFAEKMAISSEGIFESGEEYMSYYGKNAVAEDYLWSEVLDVILENATVN